MQSKWKRVGQRVNAAKRWLAKAEEEFSNERPMRGELNLMLAEAELKRLKESEPVGRHAWLKHGAAFGIAVVLVCGLSAAWLLLPPANVIPAVSVVASESVKAVVPAKRPEVTSVSTRAPVDEGNLQHALVVAEATRPSVRLEEQQMVADNTQSEKVFVKERPAASIGMSDVEMRQLVRKAGQTLRGQQ